MYNLVKGMWNKLTKKEEPVIVDHIIDVPVLDVPVLDPLLTDPLLTDPLLTDPLLTDPLLTDPVEVVYIVLNEFEMENMADDDIPIEKKKDVVLDIVSNLDPIINVVIDTIINVVEDPIVDEVSIDDVSTEEVKKPKKAKKLKKS
jgi:hypothetical protein